MPPAQFLTWLAGTNTDAPKAGTALRIAAA
jgi:hypothetical protein